MFYFVVLFGVFDKLIKRLTVCFPSGFPDLVMFYDLKIFPAGIFVSELFLGIKRIAIFLGFAGNADIKKGRIDIHLIPTQSYFRMNNFLAWLKLYTPCRIVSR
jgi:hypothetical protein